MEVTDMYRSLAQITHGLSVTHDGRLYAHGQPEPAWLLRKYRDAQALREYRRLARLEGGSPKAKGQGLVARLRMAFGIA
jgi:hypothetical protein